MEHWFEIGLKKDFAFANYLVLINHSVMRKLLVAKFVTIFPCYLRESFSLVLISFIFKLKNAAQVDIMFSTYCIIMTAMVHFKISFYSSFLLAQPT